MPYPRIPITPTGMYLNTNVSLMFFANDMEQGIARSERTIPMIPMITVFSKYAAIIVFSFFLGRASMSAFNEDKTNNNQIETFTVDEVMLQISEEDITEYLLDDYSIEI